MALLSPDFEASEEEPYRHVSNDEGTVSRGSGSDAWRGAGSGHPVMAARLRL